MAKKQAESQLVRWRPYVLPVLSLTFISLAGLVAFQRVESFLIHDARFAMRPGSLPGDDSPDLRITGISRAPAATVRAVFQKDEGHSVYRMPLEERRLTLINTIPWVRTATVGRIYPNQVEVQITERTPVAFVRLPGVFRGTPAHISLIDGDGVLLPLPEDGMKLNLPALGGIREDQTLQERAARVALMERVAADLGSLGSSVSEFNISDPSNVRLIYEVDGQALTLILGKEKFGQRVRRFVDHYQEIRHRAPDAVTLDLRLGDHITAIEARPNGD